MAERDNTNITPETVKKFIEGTFPGDMAIEPLEISAEKATGRIIVDERHLHPGKFVHGGVWTALGDSVAAWVTFRNLPQGADFTTIELKLNVFGAGRLGEEIHAEAVPLHVGRSTIIVEVRMTRAGKLVANLIVSQFVLPASAGD